MKRLPTLFVSHGSPLIALFPEIASDVWTALGRAMPRPTAIVVATGHWETPAPRVGASARPPTIHDFYGFPRPLYDLRYEPPGAPAVAQRVVELLSAAGFDAAADPDRGLDHGAWVPLARMYPQAQVPVVPLSVQPARDAAHHAAVGSALAPLAEEGILVLGSGALTHNLRAWMNGIGRDATPPWVTEFAEWFDSRARAGDRRSLVAYRTHAPHASDNHPTDEHLLPFHVAMGAGGTEASMRRLHASVSQGVLAMDVYGFGDAAALEALREAADQASAEVTR